MDGPREKIALGALRCSSPPCARGSAYRCLLRFCLAFGHARVFCEVDTAVPWRMVPTASGWLPHGPAPIFAAAGCSSRERERQRGESLKVSPTSPGQRIPQGPGVSVPDFRKGVPTFPRRRQEVCAGADRSAEAFFSFGPCTARFLFGKIEKKMGGALPSHHHGCHSPSNGTAPSRKSPLLKGANHTHHAG